MMDQDKALRVAVVGQFSSGKSALINALLGEEIAPMGVTPVTAVLHRFRWSEERNAVIEHLDGTTTLVDPASLIEKPLTEQQLASVREVRVGLPSGALREIEVWDTPGFGSNTLAHELVARRALIDADIVVWVTPIDHALDRAEADKLARLRHQDTPVLLVVNKADLADDPEERDEAVADIAAEAGDLASAVVWVSALHGLRTAQTGDRSKRAQHGFCKLEPMLADLASRALKARREMFVRVQGAQIGVNDVRCSDCGVVGRFDDRFCVCGRSLEDQHRSCPRCETDNTVHRPRCRGCNLVFEDWDRARELEARAEQEIELGLLVDASATLALAIEALPDDRALDQRHTGVVTAQAKVAALVRAAERAKDGAAFCSETKRAAEALAEVGAGSGPFWQRMEALGLQWVEQRAVQPKQAKLVLDFLINAGAGSPAVMQAQARCVQEIKRERRKTEEAARRERERKAAEDKERERKAELARKEREEREYQEFQRRREQEAKELARALEEKARREQEERAREKAERVRILKEKTTREREEKAERERLQKEKREKEKKEIGDSVWISAKKTRLSFQRHARFLAIAPLVIAVLVLGGASVSFFDLNLGRNLFLVLLLGGYPVGLFLAYRVFADARKSRQEFAALLDQARRLNVPLSDLSEVMGNDGTSVSGGCENPLDVPVLESLPAPSRFLVRGSAAASATLPALWLVSLWALSLDPRACEAAKLEDRVDSWRHYLEAYPEGGCYWEALERIAAIPCEQAEKEDSIKGWESYLESRPEGRCANRARTRIEVIPCEQAEKSDSLEGWLSYLEHHPEGPCASQAATQIEVIPCESLSSQDSRDAWKAYVEEHPNGHCAAKARLRIDAIPCERARASNTEGVWMEYLRDHPAGSCADEARKRIEQIPCERARRAKTSRAWREYLVYNAHGSCVDEARSAIASCEGKSWYISAKDNPSHGFGRGMVRCHLQCGGPPCTQNDYVVYKYIDADFKAEIQPTAFGHQAVRNVLGDRNRSIRGTWVFPQGGFADSWCGEIAAQIECPQ